MSTGNVAVNALCREAAKLKLEGNNFYKMKKYKAAANKYREAIDKDPSCSVYYTNLCTCLNHLKLYKEMNSAATKCIDIDENSVKGHYWLIMSLKHLKKFKEAFDQSEAALQKFPGNFDLQLVHSELGEKMKRCENANCPNRTSDFNSKDLLRCSSCKLVYYCSKSCQEKDWSRHKLACRMKGALNFDCASCKKRFPVIQMKLCRICNGGDGYCSSICEENDKERHEPQCKILQKEAFSKELMDFTRKWNDSKVSQPILELATHALTKKEFLSTNPDFYIEIELYFDGKYCSFVPTKPPKIIYFSDLTVEGVADIKQLFAQYKDSIGPFELSHVIYVNFRMNGKEVTMRRHASFGAKSYRRLTFEEAMTLSFNHINNMYNPILPPLWMDIFYERLQEQITGWIIDNQALIWFVLTSFRCQSKTSFRPPDQYVLVFVFEHGEKLGEVKQIVSCSMTNITDVKDADENEYLVQKLQEIKSITTEGEYTFFLTFKSKKYHLKSRNKMDFPLTIPISSTQIPQMKEKDINKEIRRLWKLLLKIPFPRCPPTPEYPNTFNEGR